MRKQSISLKFALLVSFHQVVDHKSQANSSKTTETDTVKDSTLARLNRAVTRNSCAAVDKEKVGAVADAGTVLAFTILAAVVRATI